MLISGAERPVDLDDLKLHTVYSGIYDENHTTIKIFWLVLKMFTDEEKRKFLKFVTSCSRPPLLGFGELNPKFCIRDAGPDLERVRFIFTAYLYFLVANEFDVREFIKTSAVHGRKDDAREADLLDSERRRL